MYFHKCHNWESLTHFLSGCQITELMLWITWSLKTDSYQHIRFEDVSQQTYGNGNCIFPLSFTYLDCTWHGKECYFPIALVQIQHSTSSECWIRCTTCAEYLLVQTPATKIRFSKTLSVKSSHHCISSAAKEQHLECGFEAQYLLLSNDAWTASKFHVQARKDSFWPIHYDPLAYTMNTSAICRNIRSLLPILEKGAYPVS